MKLLTRCPQSAVPVQPIREVISGSAVASMPATAKEKLIPPITHKMLVRSLPTIYASASSLAYRHALHSGYAPCAVETCHYE